MIPVSVTCNLGVCTHPCLAVHLDHASVRVTSIIILRSPFSNIFTSNLENPRWYTYREILRVNFYICKYMNKPLPVTYVRKIESFICLPMKIFATKALKVMHNIAFNYATSLHSVFRSSWLHAIMADLTKITVFVSCCITVILYIFKKKH